MSTAPAQRTQLVTALQYLGLLGTISFVAIAAFLEISTDLHLSAATVEELQEPYEVRPDGTAIYRFGNRAEYSVTCDGSTPVTWRLPANRDASELVSLCENIQAKRADDAPVGEIASG